MNRNLVNSKLDKYRERGKGTYTFCQVGCDCNIAVNLLEKCENLQSKIDKAIEYVENHTDKLKTTRIPKIDFNYNELLDILKEDK